MRHTPRWKQFVAFFMGIVLGTCFTADAGTNITFNGTGYTVPAVGDASWGLNVSNYLIAIANGALQKTGGAFTLTNEVDFGTTYGLKAQYFKSKTSVLSNSGVLRLGTSDAVSWRNSGNSADLPLLVDGNNNLDFNGNQIYTNAASLSANGYLASSDWATFNAKQSALTIGNLTEATSSVLTISGGTGAVIGSGASIQVKQSGNATSGYLSSADWIAFNGIARVAATSSSNGYLASGDWAAFNGGGRVKATATTNGYLASGDWTTFNAKLTASGGLLPSYLDYTEISTPSNPSSGVLRLYSKSGDSLYTLNSSGTETQVGSGSGQKNYLQAGSNTATGWTASGSGITAATDTTAADLPRNITTKTGILLTGVTGNSAYAFYNFQLDSADYGVKQQVQFAQACGLAGGATSSCANSDFRLDVESCTVAWSGSPATTCSGTQTRLPLAPTDVSSVTALPLFTGTYSTTFDAPNITAPYIQVRVGLNATQTHSIVLSDVVVGPGLTVQAAAVGALGNLSFTPSAAFGTTANGSYQAYRIGNAMRVQGRFTSGTVANSTMSLALPTGYSIDSTSLSTQASGQPVGIFVQLTSATGNNLFSVGGVSGYLFFDGSDTANIYFAVTSTTNALNKANGTSNGNSSTPYEFNFTIPIAQWPSTVNMAQNGCTYAYNTGNVTSAGGSDTTSFGYGGAGTPILSYNSTTTASSTQFTVQFLTTIQNLYMQCNNGHVWGLCSDMTIGDATQGGFRYGVSVSGSTSTQAVVSFNNGGFGATNTTYNTAGSAWSGLSGWSWRVANCPGAPATGFGQVTQTAAGLVQSAGQLLGTNTNDTAAAGNVGEYVSASVSSSTAVPGSTGQWGDCTSISLTAGDWDISGVITFGLSGATMTNEIDVGISTHSGNVTTGLNFGDTAVAGPIPTSSQGSSMMIPSIRASLSGTTTYYLKESVTYSAGNPTERCRISARRVR